MTVRGKRIGKYFGCRRLRAQRVEMNLFRRAGVSEQLIHRARGLIEAAEPKAVREERKRSRESR